MVAAGIRSHRRRGTVRRRSSRTHITVVWEIARRIKQVSKDNKVPPLDPVPGVDAIWNAFEPRVPPFDFDSPQAVSGPDAAVFAYATGDEWRNLISINRRLSASLSTK